NPAAARALREYLDEVVTAPITMIFGVMRDKALTEIASILFPVARELILTQIENPRAASIEMMKSAVPDNLNARVHGSASAPEALRIAREVTPNGLICVTGSLYLIGEVQQSLRRGSESTQQLQAGSP